MKNVTIILFFMFSYIFTETVGGYPGSSFKYGSNSREIAMSGAMLCSYNNGFNALGNPALLAKIKTNEYGFTYFPMSLGRNIQAISLSNVLPPLAGMSLSFLRTGTNKISLKDDDNNLIENVDHSEVFGLMSFGTSIEDLSFGISIKAIFNNLTSDFSGKGVGFDLGFLYDFNDKLNIGFLFKNINTNFIWNNINDSFYEETIPSIISFGFGYQNNSLTIVSQYDITDANGNKFKEGRVGLEFNMIKYSKYMPIVFRCGKKIYKSSTSFGFGLPVKINNDLELMFDYAIDLGYVEEGVSHLISFTIK